MLKSNVAKRARVLICAKGWPPNVGGVQTYSEFVARAYLRRGLEVVVISLFDAARGWHEKLYPEGKMKIWNVGESNQAASFMRMLAASHRLLAQEAFDFVHATTWRPALAASVWRGSVPMVLSIHGQEVLQQAAWMKPFMRGVLGSVETVVSVSPSTMAAAEGVFSKKPSGHWITSFNGLSYPELASASPFQTRDEEQVTIYTFCRLAERKNVDGALRALRILVDQGTTNFHYVVGGSGPMKAELERLIDSLDLRSWVTMLGYVPEEDIVPLYRNADIFLHPQTAPQNGADLEGFGLAIADAMSFGALAVVGEAGGPADFVKDGENGIVVDGENINAIAQALARALNDKAFSTRLRNIGRRWALDNLSWDKHLDDILHALPTGTVNLEEP